MLTNKTDSFTSTLSINPYSQEYFNTTSNFINTNNFPNYEKKQFVLSYLNTKQFISSQMSISKNIPDEDIFDAIYNKAYDDLGLDQAIEYNLQYIESFNALTDEDRNFQVFIINPLEIDETFQTTIETIKYIDIIIPLPLLIQSLYYKEIIQTSGTQCFVYLQENDAFIAIYKEHEFSYAKSIKYSFIEMHERFCELFGEKIDFNEFMEFFSTQNLKISNSNYKSFFIKVYKELFSNISEILTYAKRAFEISKFEKIYIGAQVQTTTKLHEMMEVELNIKSEEFNFNYGFENHNTYIDQIHSLMQLYVTIPEGEKYLSNFTLYERPSKFTKRNSGKLIIIIAISTFLAFSYPVTYWALTYAQDLQRDLLLTTYNEVHITKTTRESTFKNKERDKVKSLKLLAFEKKEYIDKKNTLIKIHDVKVNYAMKAKILALLTKDLNKFQISLNSITYFENTKTKQFIFALKSNEHTKITLLIEHLTLIHDTVFTFSLESIIYDKKSQKYLSDLKVKLL